MQELLRYAGKICLVVGNLSYVDACQAIDKVALAEFRIDLLDFTPRQYASLFGKQADTIATYRNNNNIDVLERNYKMAIDCGCTFVDIDTEVPETVLENIVSYAKANDVKVIISYHNYQNTPTIVELREIVDKLFSYRADIAKIACMANSKSDSTTILGLYQYYENIIALCMGNMGKITRLAAPLLGAPFTYAALNDNEIAKGQIKIDDLITMLNILSPE